MSFTRKQNTTPDADIPYNDFPNKSLYMHGSTHTKMWREIVIDSLSAYDILLLDPWKDSWSSYTNALQNEIEQFEDLSSQGISSGVGGIGTGIVDGYTPMVIPDIENTPFFWEKRNSEACAFHFFGYDSSQDMANHVLIQMVNAINTNPNKVIVYIDKLIENRINYSIFLKSFPRENYFSNINNAILKLKQIMNL